MTSGPEFFVPHVDDPEKAEELWNATRRYMEEQNLHPGDRRIFRLIYMYKGRNMVAEVGSRHLHARAMNWETFEEQGKPQEVLAILEGARPTGPFMVCTWDRGVKRDPPIMVGPGEVSEVVYFAGYGPDD